MNAAQINGHWVHYRLEGAGPLVVFANSLGTDLRIWDAVVAQMPGVRVLRYDLRGHGLSESPPGPYAMADLTGDLAGLLDHLGLRADVLAGLSIGGVVAQALAHARPDLVARLAVVCSAARIGTPEMWQDRIDAVAAGGLAAIAPAVLARWFAPGFAEAAPDEMALARTMLLRTPADGYAACCAALAAADLTETTAQLTLPTLVVAGEADGAAPPELVQATAALIPGARFVCLDGVGHIPCLEAPDRLAALLQAHLEETV